MASIPGAHDAPLAHTAMKEIWVRRKPARTFTDLMMLITLAPMHTEPNEVVSERRRARPTGDGIFLPKNLRHQATKTPGAAGG